MRGLLDDGHSLASAETIVGLQDELAAARADAAALRSDADRLRSDELTDLRPAPCAIHPRGV